MATAEELQGQIASARVTLVETVQRGEQLDQDMTQAIERQRLRRELEAIQNQIQGQRTANSSKSVRRQLIDQDSYGPHTPDFHTPDFLLSYDEYVSSSVLETEGEIDVSTAVKSGEYTWKLRGMSWLENAMQDNLEDYVYSDIFKVGSEPFDLLYAPKQVCVDDADTLVGSLVIRHQAARGIIFRYKMFIRRSGGDFVQWGEDGHECHPLWTDEGKAFGPDVQQKPVNGAAPGRAIGIFGLKHRDLILSEWVERDTLTVRVHVEVLEQSCTETQFVREKVDVPAPTMAADFLSMFENKKHTDIIFVVEGQHIKAHSVILSARSEFFDAALHSGMQESLSKVVEVTDTDVSTFEALLRFLYTDDLGCVETMIENKVKEATSREGASNEQKNDPSTMRVAIQQNLLLLSHRYQVQRLRKWCEQNLCKHVCKDQVCSLLIQACLYEAKHLEKACLNFIKSNSDAVMSSPAFGSLSLDWPHVMLKINTFLANLSDSTASAAMVAQEEARKKRSMQPEAEEVASPKRTRTQ